MKSTTRRERDSTQKVKLFKEEDQHKYRDKNPQAVESSEGTMQTIHQ